MVYILHNTQILLWTWGFHSVNSQGWIKVHVIMKITVYAIRMHGANEIKFIDSIGYFRLGAFAFDIFHLNWTEFIEVFSRQILTKFKSIFSCSIAFFRFTFLNCTQLNALNIGFGFEIKGFQQCHVDLTFCAVLCVDLRRERYTESIFYHTNIMQKIVNNFLLELRESSRISYFVS